jgi:hypothetical protein
LLHYQCKVVSLKLVLRTSECCILVVNIIV